MIKVAEWGTGMMGQGLLGYILDRPKDIDLVGVIVTNPAKEGKTVGELLDRPCDVKMTTDFEAVLAKKPDVVCINTQSNLDEVEPQILPALKAGCNVICIAEKISYPWASDPERADLFDRVAKENGVSILGTGINPGFVLDALIVMWSSICLRVDSIEASRVNDLSPFGPTVMVGQGVGTTVEQFEKGVADGSIVGHIGFPESIELIAKALDWKIDEIVETREPIVTEVERSTPHVHVPAGWVAGCKQVGKGYVERRAQDPPHPPAADPPRDGRPGHRRLHQDRRRPQREHGQLAGDPGRQGHLRQHRQLHPADEGRQARHAHRGRHAAAALLDADGLTPRGGCSRGRRAEHLKG